MQDQRNCDACGRAFITKSHAAKYCSAQCRQAAWKARQAGVIEGPVAPISGQVLPPVPPVSAAIEQGGAVALDALASWLAATLDALPADQRAIFGPRVVGELRAITKAREAAPGGTTQRGPLDDARARRAEQTMGLPAGTLDDVPDHVVVKLLTAHRSRSASS